MAGWLFVPNRKYAVCNVPGFNYIDLVNKRYSNDSCRKPKIETVYECKTPCSCCLLFYSKIVPCQLHLHYEAEETRHSPSSYKQSPFSYGLCSHLSPLQWNPELSSPKRSYKGSSADIWTIVFHWPVSDNQRKMLNVLLQWMQRYASIIFSCHHFMFKDTRMESFYKRSRPFLTILQREALPSYKSHCFQDGEPGA